MKRISMLILSFAIILPLLAGDLTYEDAQLAASMYQVASVVSDPDFFNGPDIDVERTCEGCEEGVFQLHSGDRFDVQFSVSTTRSIDRPTEDTEFLDRPHWSYHQIISRASCMSESERKSYYKDTCNSFDENSSGPEEATEKKILLAQALGQRLSWIYDYEIANDGVNKIVSPSDQYAAICSNKLSGNNHEVAGVCRHSAVTISEYLIACGFDKDAIRQPAYATTGGGHIIVSVATPYGVYTINWSEGYRSDTSDGSYELDSQIIPDAGVVLGWYDYEGKFLGNSYTPVGIMLDNVFNGGQYSGADPENFTQSSIQVIDKKLGLTTEFQVFNNDGTELQMNGVAGIITYKPGQGFYGHAGVAYANGELREGITQELIGYDLILGFEKEGMRLDDSLLLDIGGEVHALGSLHKTGEYANGFAAANPASELSTWANLTWEIQEQTDTQDGHTLSLNGELETEVGLHSSVDEEVFGEPGFLPGAAPPEVRVGTQYLFEAADGHYLVADLNHDYDFGLQEGTTTGRVEFGKDETNVNMEITRESYEYTDLVLTTISMGTTVELKKDTVYFDMQTDYSLDEGSTPGGTISLRIKR